MQSVSHPVSQSLFFRNSRVVQTSTSGTRWLRFWARPVWSLWTDWWRLSGTMWWTSRSTLASAWPTSSPTGPSPPTQSTTKSRVRLPRPRYQQCLSAQTLSSDIGRSVSRIAFRNLTKQILTFPAVLPKITNGEVITSADGFWTEVTASTFSHSHTSNRTSLSLCVCPLP